LKARQVFFAPEAVADLEAIADWVAGVAGAAVATAYIDRLEDYCMRLDIASERGLSRDDVRSGLRVVGFEKKLTIAFIVEADSVTILRIHAGGRSWADVLA
jgi:toxin ParE1/3/4